MKKKISHHTTAPAPMERFREGLEDEKASGDQIDYSDKNRTLFLSTLRSQGATSVMQHMKGYVFAEKCKTIFFTVENKLYFKTINYSKV